MNALYRTNLTDLCYGFCAFHRRYLDFLCQQATLADQLIEHLAPRVQCGSSGARCLMDLRWGLQKGEYQAGAVFAPSGEAKRRFKIDTPLYPHITR